LLCLTGQEGDADNLTVMVGCGFQRFVRVGRVSACAALVVGCTQIHNDPINLPLTPVAKQAEVQIARADPPTYDDTVIAVTFSGGGTRAAAFSYGVLQGFDETHVAGHAGTASLLDRIDFVSGVSGGSVLAAYYGLKKRQALADFKQRFLLANAQEDLQMDLSFLNIARGLQGGINDSNAFPNWLDKHLFDHATFKDLYAAQGPEVWINASDIYSRTTFIFGQVTFSALCSDLLNYPLSLAVSASAAVPVIFAPVVIQNYPGGCPTQLPAWVERVRHDDNASPLIRSYADALERYRTGEVKYVKLLDGGLVDNYGLAGFTIARLASDTPYGPLSPQEAVKLRRLLFLVVDSGRAPSGAWAQTVSGPSGVELINAASDTATGSGALGAYSTFDGTMDDWQADLVRWRCRLSEAERARYGAPPGWNCKDVKFFVGRISFDQFTADRATALNAVETSLHLQPQQVDLLIDAGRDALKSNNVFRDFLRSYGGAPALPRVSRPAPVASSAPAALEAQAQ
jgi:NTE family protein